MRRIKRIHRLRHHFYRDARGLCVVRPTEEVLAVLKCYFEALEYSDHSAQVVSLGLDHLVQERGFRRFSNDKTTRACARA